MHRPGCFPGYALFMIAQRGLAQHPTHPGDLALVILLKRLKRVFLKWAES